MALCSKHKLPNGLEVLLVPNKQAPVVALQGWIRFGSADETDEIAGLAHLFEHLLFKGTEKRAVGMISREIEGLGGDLNAYTSYDQTVMHLTLASKHADAGLDILADSLQNSVIEPDELVREREVVLEEIRRRNDMPGAIAVDLMRGELFKGHTYARPVIGYADVVAAMSRETILAQYKKHYNASNLFLVIAGDIEEGRILKTCERLFQGLKPGYVPPRRPQPSAIAGIRQNFRHHSSPDSLVHLSWLATDAVHADAAALDAFALILGQGESSRLVRKLVHDEKLVRETGAGCWTPKDRGSFGVVFKGQKGMTSKFPQILASLESCLGEHVSEAELEKAKKNLLSTATYSKETVDGLAQRFGYCEAVAGDWQLDTRYLEDVRRLTVQDLERVRREYLSWTSGVAAGGIVTAGDPIPVVDAPKARPAKATAVAKAKTPTGEVESFRFRGLDVVLKTQTHLPMFCFRWVGLGGTRLEAPAKGGVGALWSRCVSEGGTAPDGTEFSRTEVNEIVDASSASFSAFHGRNSWGFQIDGLSEDFEKLLQPFAASLDRPDFDGKIFQLEKKHLLEDLRASDDQPGSVVSRLYNEALFGKHAYGRPGSGRPETVKKISDRDLESYHAKCVEQPQVLSVVGDISRARLEKALNELFGDVKFPGASPLRKKTKLPPLKKDVVVRQKLDKEQTHILWGFRTCDLFHEDRWALMGLSAVLSGMGGRLFNELREKLSLCYTVSPSHVEGFETGSFGFYIATSPDKEETALAALRKEVEKLLDVPVPKAEWEHAVSYYTGNHEIEQQRFSGQAMGMALDQLYGSGWQEYYRFADKLRKVTPADLQRVARKYLDFRKLPSVLAVVGPKG
jgi:zinc protease